MSFIMLTFFDQLDLMDYSLDNIACSTFLVSLILPHVVATLLSIGVGFPSLDLYKPDRKSVV